jgi:hypothetical protein
LVAITGSAGRGGVEFSRASKTEAAAAAAAAAFAGVKTGAIGNAVVIKQMLGGVGVNAVLLVFALATADCLLCSGCCGPAQAASMYGMRGD